MMIERYADLEVQTHEGSQAIRVDGEELQRPLSEVLRRHGLPLNTRCGQRGLCDGCLVDIFSEDEAEPTTQRACEWLIPSGRTVIRIPERSRAAYAPQVLENFRINVPFAHDPIESDGANGSAVADLGAAVDVGTTTVAVLLVDLTNGKLAARTSDFNRQMHLGDDVLTRINLCMTDPAMLPRFQSSIAEETLGPLIHATLEQAGAHPDRLAGVTVSGNTTMLHLLAGEDPTPMGVAPFTPRFVEHRRVSHAELGLPLQSGREVPVHLLPSATAYIGADMVAGVAATGLLYDPGPALLVDVGTNGEIILNHEGRLTACATAAGPAFEGAGLSHGLRAGRGAIDRIEIDREPFAVRHHVIGDVPPVGLCGSAYIDFLAQGRTSGLLLPTGRFAADPPTKAAARLTADPGYGRSFRVAADLHVTEADIAKLLQAKAAIAAGILTLLDLAGLRPADVRRLHLAGGFGMSLDLGHAIAAGLLPGFEPSQIELVGNTSLAGAYLALMDRSILRDLGHIRQQIEPIELNLTPGFEDRYLDLLSLD